MINSTQSPCICINDNECIIIFGAQIPLQSMYVKHFHFQKLFRSVEAESQNERATLAIGEGVGPAPKELL